MKKREKSCFSSKKLKNIFLVAILCVLAACVSCSLMFFHFSSKSLNTLESVTTNTTATATELIDRSTIDHGGGTITFSVQDYVYFPSYNDVKNSGNYGFTTNNDRLCEPTDWTLANFGYYGTNSKGMGGLRTSGTCKIWCRSANSADKVSRVNDDGSVGSYAPNDEYRASRCAVHLNLSGSVSALNSGLASVSTLTHQGKTYHIITLNRLMWPQTKLNATTESTLISELNAIKDDDSYKTGRVFVGRTTNITSVSKTIMGENNAESTTGGSEEYEYNGNYYALVPEYGYVTGYTYTDGTLVAQEGISNVWIKVEPIKWVIVNWSAMPTAINSSGNGSATYINAYSVYGLVSGFDFYPNAVDTNRTCWTGSCWRAYLNGYDLNEKSDAKMAPIKANFKGQGFLDMLDHPIHAGKPQEIFTYDGNLKTLTYDTDAMTFTSGTASATNVGTYTATFTANFGYVFDDGTTEYVHTWAIIDSTYTAIAKPSISSNSFVYSGSSQGPTAVGFNDATMLKTDDVTATDVGDYNITFGIKDKSHYYWNDNTINDFSLPWEITRGTLLAIPSQNGTLTYSGSPQTPQWNNYDSNKLIIDGTYQSTNAGTYTATFTPNSNWKWSDGTLTSKSANWSIQILTLTVPSQNGIVYYTGSAVQPNWNNYNATHMIMSGETSRTEPGIWTAIFSLASPENTKWSDNTTSAKNVNWTLARAQLTKPTLKQNSFIYNASTTISMTSSTYVNDYNSSFVSALGDVTATNAGDYVTVYTIKDPVHYEWIDDGTVDAVSYTWTISKITLTTPTLVTSSFDFTANTITVSMQDFDSTYMAVQGRTSQSHAGTYYFTVYIKDDYKESIVFDNGRDFVIFEWTILPYDISNATIVIS